MLASGPPPPPARPQLRLRPAHQPAVCALLWRRPVHHLHGGVRHRCAPPPPPPPPPYAHKRTHMLTHTRTHARTTATTTTTRPPACTCFGELTWLAVPSRALLAAAPAVAAMACTQWGALKAPWSPGRKRAGRSMQPCSASGPVPCPLAPWRPMAPCAPPASSLALLPFHGLFQPLRGPACTPRAATDAPWPACAHSAPAATALPQGCAASFVAVRQTLSPNELTRSPTPAQPAPTRRRLPPPQSARQRAGAAAVRRPRPAPQRAAPAPRSFERMAPPDPTRPAGARLSELYHYPRARACPRPASHPASHPRARPLTGRPTGPQLPAPTEPRLACTHPLGKQLMRRWRPLERPRHGQPPSPPPISLYTSLPAHLPLHRCVLPALGFLDVCISDTAPASTAPLRALPGFRPAHNRAGGRSMLAAVKLAAFKHKYTWRKVIGLHSSLCTTFWWGRPIHCCRLAAPLPPWQIRCAAMVPSLHRPNALSD